MDTLNSTPYPKTCTKCKTLYADAHGNFSKSKRTKDGYNFWCKKCINQWHDDNKAKLAEKRREWYLETMANSDKHEKMLENARKNKRKYAADGRYKERNRKYRAKNRRGRAEYNRQWRLAHPDYYPKYKRNWDQSNRNRTRQHHRNRKMRIIKAGGYLYKKDAVRLFNQQNGQCYWCSCELSDKYHLDHIVALVNGGDNRRENLCVTCVECNQRKGARNLDEWIEDLMVWRGIKWQSPK